MLCTSLQTNKASNGAYMQLLNARSGPPMLPLSDTQIAFLENVEQCHVTGISTVRTCYSLDVASEVGDLNFGTPTGGCPPSTLAYMTHDHQTRNPRLLLKALLKPYEQ